MKNPECSSFFQLEGIETRSGFNQSRFSLEFYLAAFSPTAASDDDSGSANSSSMEPYEQSTKILDDEHTPGIFEVKKAGLLALKKIRKR